MLRFGASTTCILLLSVYIADAQAQYKCTKDGKVTYSDKPCPEAAGKGASQQQMTPAAPPSTGLESGARPSTGFVRSGSAPEVGLWETSTQARRRGAPPEARAESLGIFANLGGRTLKSVSCDEKPFKYLIDLGKCKAQFASRGGKCVIEEPAAVTTVTGNYTTTLRVEIVFTVPDASAPGKVHKDELTNEYRHLGACKPDMTRGDKFFVKDNGDWIPWKEFEQARTWPK